MRKNTPKKALKKPTKKSIKKHKKVAPYSNYDFIEEKTDKFWDKKAYKQCIWQYFIKVKKGKILKPIDYSVVWLTFNEIGTNAEKMFKEKEEKKKQRLLNPNVDYIKKLDDGLEKRGYKTFTEKKSFVLKTTKKPYPPSQEEAQSIIALILKKEIENKK